MPTLSALTIYPIKSCRGIDVPQATLTPWGLAHDRAWMVVDAQGSFLTQRQHPRMAQIVPSFTAEGTGDLQVVAPKMPPLQLPAQPSGAACTVQVWQDKVSAGDAGDAAAAWFSTFLGVTARLVRFDTECQRPSATAWTGGLTALNQFSDGFPILVANQASLDDLNQRLAQRSISPISMARFRPNLVLTGLAAYEEDYLDTLTLAGTPEVVLKLVKPCARCPIPTRDPLTGESTPNWPTEPLDTLASYHTSAVLNGAVTFGVNAIVLSGLGAILRLGQAGIGELRFD